MGRVASRWVAALGWALVGALAGVGIAAVASIGFLLLGGAALLATILAASRAPGAGWALVGAGLALATLGAFALPWRSCPDVTPTLSDPPGPGESSTYSCGGLHPGVWFGLAALAVASGVAALRGGLPAPQDPAHGWQDAPERAARGPRRRR